MLLLLKIMASPKLWQDPFKLFTGHNYLSPIPLYDRSSRLCGFFSSARFEDLS